MMNAWSVFLSKSYFDETHIASLPTDSPTGTWFLFQVLDFPVILSCDGGYSKPFTALCG